MGIHLVFFHNLEFHRDELLYFSMGSHPAAGYASVPPMTGWIAFLMIRLMGYSILAARLVPALGAGVMVVLTDAITRELKGNAFARIVVAVTIVIMPFSLRIFYLFQPVFLEYLDWSLILYLVLRYVNTRNSKLILLIGLVAGLGLLTKYLVGLLILSLALVIPFTRHRRVFTEKNLYIAIAIAVLIFLPNVLWQLTHGLPVLYHMNALASRQLVHVDRMSILTDLVVFSGPGFLLFIPGLLFLLISNRLKSYRMFAWVAIFVVGILVALKGKSYYAVGILPFLMAAGGIFLEKVLKKTFSRVFTVALITIVGLLLLPAGVPVFGPAGLEKYFRILTSVIKNTDILRFEDGQIHPLPQDYSDMIGWNELTQVTAELYRSLPDKQSTRIYAENYGEAGAINVIGRQYGLPQPLCFAESFLYWNPREFPVEIKTLIYINEERPGKDVYEMFEEVTPMGSITQPLSREYGTTVYLCTHPRKSFNAAWKDLVNMRKNPFR